MKRKILIVGILISLVLIIIFCLNEKKELDLDDVELVSDINTIVTNENIQDVDFSNLEFFDIDLTETLKITKGGVYTLTGIIDDGYIYIDTKESVKLVLNNVKITNKSGPAIMVENSDVIYIELANDSVNYLTDGADYTDLEEGEPNGTIFSKDDLILAGDGKLIISSNYEDGIVSKDNLKIISGNYEINSFDDAIRGKDSLVILNGSFKIDSGGDGIKATNDTDNNLGFILIENGNFEIIANNDGIQAETDLVINGGIFDIETGNGSSNSSTTNNDWGNWQKPFDKNFNMSSNNNINTDSAKGLKATKNIIVKGGEFVIDSSDDSIHSNEYIGISNGKFLIQSGDDGIHADNEIIIDNGDINIKKSYEGIEAESITINDGIISIISSDDGTNAAGGNDSSSMNGRPGMNNFAGNGNSKITINGGNIFVDSSGDGIDANGSIYINDGTIVVNGPTNSGNGSLDYDTECKIKGGLLVASGSSGMAQGMSSSSTQNSVMINFTKIISAGELISIYDNNGEEIITYQASKDYQNLVVSTFDLKLKNSYVIYIGGNSTAEEKNGLYDVGGYSNGNEYATFTINNLITNIGSNNAMGMGQAPNNPGMKPGMNGSMNHR